MPLEGPQNNYTSTFRMPLFPNKERCLRLYLKYALQSDECCDNVKNKNLQELTGNKFLEHAISENISKINSYFWFLIRTKYNDRSRKSVLIVGSNNQSYHIRSVNDNLGN